MKQKLLALFPFFYLLYQMSLNFSTEMSLPAFLSIARDLGTDLNCVQGTITAMLMGLLTSQLFLGAIADRYGNKVVLLGGGIAFILAAYGASLAQHISFLFLMRYIHGIGIGSMMIAGYAQIQQMYDRQVATRILTWVTSASAASQMMGTFLGSLVLERAGWRAIFILVFYLSTALLFFLALTTPKTQSWEESVEIHPLSILRGYFRLLRHKPFIFHVLAGSMIYSGGILWLTSAPYLVLKRFQMTPEQFGWIQMPVYASFIAAALSTGWLLQRWERWQAILAGTLLCSICAIVMAIALLFSPRDYHYLVLLIPMMGYMVGYGLVAAPVATEIVLCSGAKEGMATGAYFFLMFGSGIFSSLVMSILNDSSALFASCLILVSVSALCFYRAGRKALHP